MLFGRYKSLLLIKNPDPITCSSLQFVISYGAHTSTSLFKQVSLPIDCLYFFDTFKIAMSAIQDKDRLVAYNRELNNILTEADRKKINQVLKKFSSSRDAVPTIEKEKEIVQDVPHITTLTLHDEFPFENAPSELDEIPHFFLFRTFFAPLIRYKIETTLEHIQMLCLKSGVTDVVHNSVNKVVDRLAGQMPKGGLVKGVILFLHRVGEEKLYIKQCIFKGAT